MDFNSLRWRKQKSIILPLAASLCVNRYDLTLKGIDKGTGEGNDFSYRVEAWEGIYQSCVYSPRSTYDQVLSVFWYTSELKRAIGLMVPEAMHGVDGNPIQQIPIESKHGDFHCCTLYEWIGADLLSQISDVHDFPSMIKNLGEKVAQMHLHSKYVQLPEWFSLRKRGIDNLDKWINRLETEPIQQLHPDFDSYESYTAEQLIGLANELRSWMIEQDESSDQFGIIHGGLNCDNLLFQGTEPCVIDFPSFCYGYFDMDLVKALDHGIPPKNHSDFLSGYTSVRPLCKF